MAIPAPLAYPPTALRNVAAGLVVGNPIGSSGTRAKALTSAELKAVVEASGISYLPLSGGTLTGPITGTGGLIEHRDGLTAQCLDIFETYTSGTNNGKLRFKATSSGHQIGSARATSGSNRAVQLGHFDAAGTFSTGLIVTTSGDTCVSSIGALSGASKFVLSTIGVSAPLLATTGSSISGISPHDTGATIYRNSNPTVDMSGAQLAVVRVAKSRGYGWTSTTSAMDTMSTVMVSDAAGDAGVYGSDGATLGIWRCGQIVMVPPSLVTLSTNGQFSIEMTSNTAGNLVYRGSDGTTRRMSLTFS